MKKIGLQQIFVLIVLLCGSGIVRANAGDLDPTFGGDGKVTTDILTNSDERITSLALQADGKIVAAGLTFGLTVDFALVRYNTDGTLDSTFGASGRVTTDFNGTSDFATAVAIQPDGKIVAAGYFDTNFAVARYNTNGSLDTSFSGDGKVTTDLGLPAYAQGIAIQPNSKIIVAGHTNPVSGTGQTFILRYNTDGSLDPSFDFDGKIIMDFGTDTFTYAVVIDGNNRILVAAAVSGDFALARFNPDGSPDVTFGTAGKVTTDFGGGSVQTYAMAVGPDGKIVVAGYISISSQFDFAVARYNNDGSLDLSFDFDGKTTLDFNGDDDVAQTVVLQPDGEVVLGGYTRGGASTDFAAARFNSDGSLDSTFSTDGKLYIDFFGKDDFIYAGLLQPDGKVVLGGWARDAAGVVRDFALVRCEGDPLPACLYCDDFEDGVLAVDWTYVKGSWSESGGNLVAPAAGKAIAVASPVFAGCTLCSFETSVSVPPAGGKVWMLAWYVNQGEVVEVLINEKKDKIIVKQKHAGSVVAKMKASVTILPNTAYTVAANFDGTVFHLLVDGVEVGTLTAAVAPQPGTIGLKATTNALFGQVLVQ